MMNNLDDLNKRIREIRFPISNWPADRGQVCGWPYREDGCTPGNCSMRPGPEVRACDDWRDYTHDIAAAWELAGDAERAGVGFDLCNCETTHYETGKEPTKTYSWVATFYDPWGGPACQEYKAEAPTAADAISRAYYAWRRGGQI
jgi:hypothetical protein